MEEFNLKEALAGRLIQTRDGQPARIICTDAKGSYPLIALITSYTGEEFSASYTKKGEWKQDSQSDNDLVMAEGVYLIGDMEVYTPEQTRPGIGDVYYIPVLGAFASRKCTSYEWEGCDVDIGNLNAGLVYLEEHKARRLAEALEAMIK